MPAGRPKGSQNKRSGGQAREIARSLKVEPLREMLKCAIQLRKDGEIEKAGNMFGKALPFLHQTQGTVTLKQDEESPLEITMVFGNGKD